MKNLLFGLIATVLFSNSSFGQMNNPEWKAMISDFNKLSTEILIKECPKEMDVKDFKASILEGKNKLSEEGTKRIIEISTPIIEYGVKFAEMNKIDVSDFKNEEFLTLGAMFYPEIKLSDDIILYNSENVNQKISASEAWDCLVNAVGLGAAGSIGVIALNEAGIRIITRAVTKFLIKNAGWVGVAITLADFSFCMYDASQN